MSKTFKDNSDEFKYDYVDSAIVQANRSGLGRKSSSYKKSPLEVTGQASSTQDRSFISFKHQPVDMA